jgi:Family of unknown function (DUF6951)
MSPFPRKRQSAEKEAVMKGTADVQAGICLHTTAITAETSDGRAVDLALETTCDNVQRLAAILDAAPPVDAYKEIDPRGESAVLAMGREAACCTDCIVPASALKAMRVATGLALPADAAIAISKE